MSVATTIAELEGLRPLWSEIQERTPGTMFQDFEWNLLALRTFPEESPYFVAAEQGASAAIVPAVLRGDEIRLAGGPLFDYRDALCTEDSEALPPALVRLLESGLPWKIEGARAQQRWSTVGAEEWTVAPYAACRDISADAFAGLHTRARRSLRRLADEGASIKKMSATPNLVEQIYRKKAKEPDVFGINIFRDERCIEFMRAVVQLPGTRCEIFLMEASGESIAALVTFIDGATRRFYTTWMDQRWSRRSPGIALLYEATCRTLAAGLDCDYMTGEQPYKVRFATGSTPLYRIETSAQLIVPATTLELPRAA